MPVSVKKNKGENSQRIVYRFIKAAKKSGVLLEVRKRMYRRRQPNDTKRRASALHRLDKQKEYQELKLWGKA